MHALALEMLTVQKKYCGFIEEKSLPYHLVPNFLDNSLLQEKHVGASTAHTFQREQQAQATHLPALRMKSLKNCWHPGNEGGGQGPLML